MKEELTGLAREKVGKPPVFFHRFFHGQKPCKKTNSQKKRPNKQRKDAFQVQVRPVFDVCQIWQSGYLSLTRRMNVSDSDWQLSRGTDVKAKAWRKEHRCLPFNSSFPLLTAVMLFDTMSSRIYVWFASSHRVRNSSKDANTSYIIFHLFGTCWMVHFPSCLRIKSFSCDHIWQ